MNIPTVTDRLTSWRAFFEREAWLASLADLPTPEACSAALLAGAPAWVTVDPLPDDACPLTDDLWDVDMLIDAAMDSGDPEAAKLATIVRELAELYMGAEDVRDVRARLAMDARGAVATPGVLQ